MALRTLAALAAKVSHRSNERSEVHFHQGPNARPVPCFTRECRSPKLDV